MKVWSKLLSFLKPQKISNKDVDLSDDNIFNRELKSIRKLKIEPFYAETGLIHTGSAKQIAEKSFKKMSRTDREKLISQLTSEMREAAKILEFEHAAYLRDKIEKLKSYK